MAEVPDIPEGATFDERLAGLIQGFHTFDFVDHIKIVLGLVGAVLLFGAVLVTLYELALYPAQRVAVLGIKKRFTKYDRWVGASVFRYIVSYKNSKGQVIEAPIKIRSMDF